MMVVKHISIHNMIVFRIIVVKHLRIYNVIFFP